MDFQEDLKNLPLDYSIVKEEYIVQDDSISVIEKQDEERSQEDFPCNLCQKTFKKEWYLKLHLKRHSGLRNYQCDHCDKKFTERAILKVHVQRIHLGMKTPELVNRYKKKFSCEHCGKITYDKYAHDKHLSIHSNIWDHQCPKCPKKFRHKDNLREHMFVHVTEKPISCNICSKTFKRKKTLTKHLRSHSEKPKDEPKNCNYCQKTLNGKESLRKHVSKFHKDLHRNSKTVEDHDKIQLNTKSLECEMCGKSFGDKIKLENHMKDLHQYKEKKRYPYVCSECGKKWSKKYSYETHLKSHGTEALFQCGVCLKNYKHKFSLVRHMKNHENKKFTALPKTHQGKVMNEDSLGDLESKEMLQKNVTEDFTINSLVIKKEVDDEYEMD